jgi:hypothetical protein
MRSRLGDFHRILPLKIVRLKSKLPNFFQEKAQLKTRIMRDEGLSPRSAYRMAKLIQQRRWISRSSQYSRDRRRTWTKMEPFLQYEFCVLMRWAKQIESAKESSNPDQFYGDLDRIVDEMRLHANNFELHSGVKRELTNVCRLPEQCLQKYKMDLVSSVL